MSEELKEYERKILGADERARALEYELFQALRVEIVPQTGRLQEIGVGLGQIDALLALAEVAVRNNYVRPKHIRGWRDSLCAPRGIPWLSNPSRRAVCAQ